MSLETAVRELQQQLRAAVSDLARYERNHPMAVDANTLGDPHRIRQAELHQMHDQALRNVQILTTNGALAADIKAAEADVAKVLKEIAVFYQDDLAAPAK